MTGTPRTSADLDPRRRRLLVRAWRRGIREMDLILGGFADGVEIRDGRIRMGDTPGVGLEDKGRLIDWLRATFG